MILFAHHVESEHLPVLAIFFCVGIWLGWQMMSVALKYLRPAPPVLAERDGGFRSGEPPVH